MRRDLCLVRHDLCVPHHDLCSLHRDLTVRFKFLYFSVKEFDEELDGEVHHRHHLLSTVALVASPGYSMAADDPDIFTDPESEPFVRAWPDQAIPRRSGPPAEIPSSIMEGLIKDLQLQHDTTVKVLKRLGVDSCKDFQRSSAVGVLARVRSGNRTCTLCNEVFSSAQVLRAHIQGQHMEAPHLKCTQCSHHAGSSYSLKLHMKTHGDMGTKLVCDHPGCGRSYTTKGHLNEHKKKHSGVKFICSRCNKSLATKSGLTSHLLSCRDPASHEPPPKRYRCDTCDRAYFRSSELTRHQKTAGH